MGNYHVRSDGRYLRCYATVGRCPYVVFGSEEEARLATTPEALSLMGSDITQYAQQYNAISTGNTTSPQECVDPCLVRDSNQWKLKDSTYGHAEFGKTWDKIHDLWSHDMYVQEVNFYTFSPLPHPFPENWSVTLAHKGHVSEKDPEMWNITVTSPEGETIIEQFSPHRQTSDVNMTAMRLAMTRALSRAGEKIGVNGLEENPVVFHEAFKDHYQAVISMEMMKSSNPAKVYANLHSDPVFQDLSQVRYDYESNTLKIAESLDRGTFGGEHARMIIDSSGGRPYVEATYFDIDTPGAQGWYAVRRESDGSWEFISGKDPENLHERHIEEIVSEEDMLAKVSAFHDSFYPFTEENEVKRERLKRLYRSYFFLDTGEYEPENTPVDYLVTPRVTPRQETVKQEQKPTLTTTPTRRRKGVLRDIVGALFDPSNINSGGKRIFSQYDEDM